MFLYVRVWLRMRRKLAKSTLILIPLFAVYYMAFIWIPDDLNPTCELIRIYFEMLFNSLQVINPQSPGAKVMTYLTTRDSNSKLQVQLYASKRVFTNTVGKEGLWINGQITFCFIHYTINF